MKKFFIVAIASALPFTTFSSWADDAHHPEKDKKAVATVPDKAQPMQMGKMQEAMMKMHEQMHKITDAKNPQEREQLMQEHAKMMQDHMKSMKGMMGGGMSSGKESKMDGMKGM